MQNQTMLARILAASRREMLQPDFVTAGNDSKGIEVVLKFQSNCDFIAIAMSENSQPYVAKEFR
jgi:hypothetical protein